MTSTKTETGNEKPNEVTKTPITSQRHIIITPPVGKRKTHFIGIHLGAGSHSLKMHDSYKTLCKSACEAGLRILKKGGSAEEAASAATTVLENSGLVNAGKGSNLTLDKTVECDAGFMSGNGHFGGVGAVGGVPNPILVAYRISELQNCSNELSCGRVPPTLLVGIGAKNWAESQLIPTCEESNLVSTKALKRHGKYMKKLKSAEKQDQLLLCNTVSDTVGVIVLDHSNKVAATVSSGGNWLKFPGRVGHSPQFGAGCWAMNRGPLSETSIAVSTTGVGEMLSKVQWAAECGRSLQNEKNTNPVEAISCAMKEKFLESDLLCHHKEPKIVGMIGLTWDGHRGEFVWGHSSQSLIVAVAGTAFKKVKMIFSTLSSPKSESIKVEAMLI